MISAEMHEIHALEDRDVHAILARNITGRIAFAVDGEIEIRPVSYVHADGFIYLRSTPYGTIAMTDPAGAPVGFEVDEIHSMTRWRSVVIKGTLFRLSRGAEQEEWLKAVGKLRRLMPQALRADDYARDRSELFRILIREATGRAMG